MLTQTGTPKSSRPNVSDRLAGARLASKSRGRWAAHQAVLARRLPKIFATEVEPGEVRTAICVLIITVCIASMAVGDVNFPAYRVLFRAFPRGFVATLGVWLFLSQFLCMIYERRSPRRLFQSFAMVFLFLFGVYTMSGTWHTFHTLASVTAWFSLASAGDAGLTLRILRKLKPASKKEPRDYGFNR